MCDPKEVPAYDTYSVLSLSRALSRCGRPNECVEARRGKKSMYAPLCGDIRNHIRRPGISSWRNPSEKCEDCTIRSALTLLVTGRLPP